MGSSNKMPKREPGHYWVRDRSGWLIAKYDGHGKWLLPGRENGVDDSFWKEIDEAELERAPEYGLPAHDGIWWEWFVKDSWIPRKIVFLDGQPFIRLRTSKGAGDQNMEECASGRWIPAFPPMTNRVTRAFNHRQHIIEDQAREIARLKDRLARMSRVSPAPTTPG
jgi:hypothetical protein